MVGGCAAVSRRPATETCPASGDESVSGLVQSQCSATRSFLISIPDVASQSTFHPYPQDNRYITKFLVAVVVVVVFRST